MNTTAMLVYKWKDIDWRKTEQTVFKLQKRIYRAALVSMTMITLLRSRVRSKVSCTVLKRRCTSDRISYFNAPIISRSDGDINTNSQARRLWF
jgi:hypothetical protein